MGIEPFTTPQRKFSGGLNLYSADIDVSENELLKAYNCRIRDKTITTAPGFRKYSTEQLDGSVKAIWGGLLNSTSYPLIVAAGTKIYSGNGIGESCSVLKTGLTSTANIYMERYLKRLFIGNGTDANMKYNGTSISNHGIVAPGSFTLTEVNPGVGAFANGQVRGFYITYWDNTNKVESSPNTTAQSITIATGPSNIQVTTLPTTTDTNVTHYRIYMTEDDGATYYRKDEISYSTYAGSNYTISSATEGTVEIEFDNDPPPTYSLVAYFKNRLYVLDPTAPAYLRFSKAFRPEQFPAPFRVGMGDAFDENIVCIARFYDYLIIGTKNAIWFLDGDPLVDSASPKLLTSFTGIAGSRAYAIFNNQFVFIGTDKKIYSLSPTDFSKTDVRPTYISRNIEPLHGAIDETLLSNAVGIYDHYGTRNEVLFAVPLSSTVSNDAVFVMDGYDGGWTVDVKRVSCFSAVTTANNNTVLFHGDENGYIYYEDSDYGGYGAVYNGTAESGTSTTLVDTSILNLNRTASSGGASTLTDSGLSLTTNQYLGYQIYIASGTGSGQYRTIASNTATVFTVSSAWSTPPDNTSVYYVGGFLENELKGLDLTIISGTGAGQRVVISSHTPTTITSATTFTTTPDSTSVYAVGAIDFDVWTGWDKQLDIGEYAKRGCFVHLSTKQNGAYTLDYSIARNQDYTSTVDYSITLSSSGSLWGVGIWGVSTWGIVNSYTTVLPFADGSDIYERIQHRFRQKYAGQPIQVNYVAVTAQNKELFLV